MFKSTKIIELGSCAFRQPQAESHCRFLHGYRLTAKFWFEAKDLDKNNWVVDFGGLKGLKKLLASQFDHTTCISEADPKLAMFESLRDAGVCDLRIMNGVGIERFAEYCHTVADAYVDEFTDGRCKCVKVEVFEHEDNSAIYEYNEPSEEVKSVNQMKRSKQLESAPKPVVSKKEKELTQPPFAKNKPVSVGNKKVKNKWLDPDSKSTWGL